MKDAEFSTRLVQARQAMGWSQSDLARECDMLPTQVSRYETGKVTPRTPVIARFAKALGISQRWLATGVGAVGDGDTARYLPSPAAVHITASGGALTQAPPSDVTTVSQAVSSPITSPTDAASDFPSRLVDARIAKGLSRAALASNADVTLDQVTRYELRKNMPRPYTIGRLAGALGVHPEWLHKGEGPRESGSTIAYGDRLDFEIKKNPDGTSDWIAHLDEETEALFQAEADKVGVPLGTFMTQMVLEYARKKRAEIEAKSNPEVAELKSQLAKTQADLKRLAEAVIRLGDSAE